MSKSADGYKSPTITYSLLRLFSESDLVVPIDNDDWLVRFLRPCKYYPDSAFELVSKFIFAHWIDQWHKYRANVPSWLLECDLNRRNVNANWKLSLAGLSIELFQFVFNFISITDQALLQLQNKTPRHVLCTDAFEGGKHLQSECSYSFSQSWSVGPANSSSWVGQ